jgi:hypothetical protein
MKDWFGTYILERPSAGRRAWDDAEIGHKAMVRQQLERVRASAKAT